MLRQNVSRFGVLSVLLACALIALPARAQVVFEDNFNGNALGAHWVTPPASHWDYDVSGGTLNVHRVLFPSHPKAGGNSAGITASFPGQGDFHARIGVRWEPSTVLDAALLIDGATVPIAQMYYSTSLVGAYAYLPPALYAPSPGAGMHDLAMNRAGSVLRFYVDGQLFATMGDQSGGAAATSVSLLFRSPFPLPVNDPPIRIDFVRIVPATTGFACVTAMLAVAALKRRR